MNPWLLFSSRFQLWRRVGHLTQERDRLADRVVRQNQTIEIQDMAIHALDRHNTKLQNEASEVIDENTKLKTRLPEFLKKNEPPPKLDKAIAEHLDTVREWVDGVDKLAGEFATESKKLRMQAIPQPDGTTKLIPMPDIKVKTWTLKSTGQVQPPHPVRVEGAPMARAATPDLPLIDPRRYGPDGKIIPRLTPAPEPVFREEAEKIAEFDENQGAIVIKTPIPDAKSAIPHVILKDRIRNLELELTTSEDRRRNVEASLAKSEAERIEITRQNNANVEAVKKAANVREFTQEVVADYDACREAMEKVFSLIKQAREATDDFSVEFTDDCRIQEPLDEALNLHDACHLNKGLFKYSVASLDKAEPDRRKRIAELEAQLEALRAVEVERNLFHTEADNLRARLATAEAEAARVKELEREVIDCRETLGEILTAASKRLRETE